MVPYGANYMEWVAGRCTNTCWQAAPCPTDRSTFHAKELEMATSLACSPALVIALPSLAAESLAGVSRDMLASRPAERLLPPSRFWRHAEAVEPYQCRPSADRLHATPMGRPVRSTRALLLGQVHGILGPHPYNSQRLDISTTQRAQTYTIHFPSF